MKSHRVLLLALLLFAVLPLSSTSAQGIEVRVLSGKAAVRESPDSRMETFVDSLLSEMTLDEKLGQLTQYRGRWGNTGPEVLEGGEAQIRAGQVGSFLGIYGAEYTKRMQKVAVEQSRLGIPLLFSHDVIHGFRTIFPVPLAEAASFDLQAMEDAARVAAREGAAAGLHWTFAPMVDVARDPRWGRVVEGAGEDPFLGSRVAEARVRGFQGRDLADPTTMLATAKHFVAYGAAEGGRDYNVADISERTLWETYLPPFKAAVDAGVGSIMASFNEVGGVPMHANETLIDGVLRDRWGFDGLVVSDYTGVMELMPHGIAATPEEAGVKALEAGVDVDMVSAIYLNDLPEAVRQGRLSTKDVDEAVRRVLRAKYKLGLFADPYRYSDAAREKRETLTDANRRAARTMAQKSIVLLKNEGGALPLSSSLGRIAVIGALADSPRDMLGNWAAAGRAEDAVTILQGIRESVGSQTEVVFARGAGVTEMDSSGFGEALRAARSADAVVLVLGEHQEMSAEANNRTNIDLPGVQQALADAVLGAGKPVVAVLVNGRPLSVSRLDETAPAILETWYLGVEAGHAVADVLFGDVNPSGKLPITFPRTVGQVPIYYNHKNTGRPADANNKYTSKYLDSPWTPLYPFGHGLSYTSFRYDNFRLSDSLMLPNGSVTASVRVTNTGAREGAEVVQFYVQDEVASITRPVQELRGFQRLALAPGASETVTFTLTPEDLAYYGPGMKWMTEPGYFKAMVGGSSADVQALRFRLME